MNATGTVLFVRGGGGDEVPGALESEFDVVVAESGVDAMKRLAMASEPPGCLVTPAAVPGLPLDAFVERVRDAAPDVVIVVTGELPPERDAPTALVAADAYVPPGRTAELGDRIDRLVAGRRIDRDLRSHERLGQVVNRVAVDVAEAADRGEIESAVYARLGSGQWYRHVWVARQGEADGFAVSRPVTGRLGDDELGTLVGSGDTGFLARAVETGRVVTAAGGMTNRSGRNGAVYDGGNPRTLTAAGVPFVHGGRVLGVALVSTDRADAFDGAERDLLADLGAVVGHALWARQSGEGDLGRGVENLVHDLRNPLGIARSHLEISREDDASESLDRVEAAIERMVDTVDRVAQSVRGEFEVEAAPEDLAGAAEAAWASVEVRTASLTVDDPANIRADHDLLVRLLANLFQNAVDHGGDHVAVRVGTTSDGFFVEDDGPGIPEVDRETVTERGYSTSKDGLGIGLSIVEDVATAHGWGLTVTVGTAGGARFEFTGVELVEENETP